MTDKPKAWFADPEPPSSQDVLYVDLEGWEGPLDLLLELARRQKVDLAGMSVLALAEQYLAFITSLKDMRIELAADYLVMAAWLALLKSRLLLPKPEDDDDEPSGEMLAAQLQLRLQRLQAMRSAAAQLMERPRLGVDVFARGAPEPVALVRKSTWQAGLYDLVAAYAGIAERKVPVSYTPAQRTVWALQDARESLQRLVGEGADWHSLQELTKEATGPAERATALASTFASSLELVRQGELELRQDETFGPLLVRRRPPGEPEAQ